MHKIDLIVWPIWYSMSILEGNTNEQRGLFYGDIAFAKLFPHLFYVSWRGKTEERQQKFRWSSPYLSLSPLKWKEASKEGRRGAIAFYGLRRLNSLFSSLPLICMYVCVFLNGSNKTRRQVEKFQPFIARLGNRSWQIDVVVGRNEEFSPSSIYIFQVFDWAERKMKKTKLWAISPKRRH